MPPSLARSQHGQLPALAATQTQARFPALRADSVQELSRFRPDGRILAAEIQNDFVLGTIARTGVGAIDNSHVIWGVQGRRDQVRTNGTLYNDRGKPPVRYDQSSLYAQLQSPVLSRMRLVVANRYDRHEKFATRMSPKAGLLYDFTPDQTVRLTYNRAYLAPTMGQFELGAAGLSANYRVPSYGTTLLLQIDNIATCVSGFSTPPTAGISPAFQATYTARQSCGLGLRHHEILNMPAVGTMVFVGARYDWR